MTGTPDDEARSSAERASFSSAREHVGAAGFAQRDALERLINAGREQIEFTQSLRQVLTATLAQLHALPLRELHEAASPHVRTLEDIVQSSTAQLQTAHEVRDAIQHTLAQVRGTPVEDISAQLLTNLSSVVHRQAAELKDLIALALHEASTAEHIRLLTSLRTDVDLRRLAAERARAEQELVDLDRAGRTTLERIRALEDGGVSLAEQKAHLQGEASAAQAHLAALEASASHDAREIAELQGQAAASRARTAELEEAALKTRERILHLRRVVEAQHRHEHEQERQAKHDDPSDSPR